ncbi:hypothetical protein NDU88_005090 [Pleurodeles waltl]|uniref:Uncharacterized protein n=1 Tax=Pleurodeles waltl TaxID=8319 RepID=A0AAV7WAU3_PLEWA|nr:hypothetical protein NDU88_005090 [Pleurodeles waltl]
MKTPAGGLGWPCARRAVPPERRLRPSAGSGERGSRSAGLDGPRVRHRSRRCAYFVPQLRKLSVSESAGLSGGAAGWGPTNGFLALPQGGLGV